MAGFCFAGEEDENMYDMERLKKPLDPAMTTDAVTFNQLGPMGEFQL